MSYRLHLFVNQYFYVLKGGSWSRYQRLEQEIPSSLAHPCVAMPQRKDFPAGFIFSTLDGLQKRGAFTEQDTSNVQINRLTD